MPEAAIFDNVLYSDDLKRKITQTLDELDPILVDHAGPFASDAIIGSRWRQSNDIDEFTKDGIKIFQHLLVNEDPIARLCARFIRFIGMTTDRRCHDGTTTSMLMFVRLARIAIEYMDAPKFSPKRLIQKEALEQIFKECLRVIGEIKITEEDLLERAAQFEIETDPVQVRYAVAYHMAMISAKGDKDLASKIATVISRMPKTIYGMVSDLPTRIETDEKYTLERQTYDMGVKCSIGDLNNFNYKNGTQYLAKRAVIFECANAIVPGSMETEFLQAFIGEDIDQVGNLASFGATQYWEDIHEGDRQLVIMSPMIQDAKLMTDIRLYNAANPKTQIQYFSYHVEAKTKNSFTKTLHYTAGVPLFTDITMADPVRSLIGLQGHDVSVHYIGTSMQISDLYLRTGEPFHPFYTNPSPLPEYDLFRKEMEDILEFDYKNVTNPALDKSELNYMTYLYRILTCQEIWDIKIGGSLHDQKANSTVYEDAMGAALSAIEHGVVLGGYGHLARAIAFADSDMTNAPEKVHHAILSLLADTLRTTDVYGLDEVIDSVITSKWDYLVADKQAFFKEEQHVHNETLDANTMKAFLDCNHSLPILMQAWAGYDEQFKRFLDMLPRLANTTHLADMRLPPDEDTK